MKKPQAIINKMIENAMAPFKRRMRTMIMRAVVELVTESTKTQSIQVSRAEDLLDDDVERFQDFGFSSVPLKDAEAIILMVGASSEHPVAIKVDDKRYRPKTLAEGESCVWIVKDGAGLIRLLCKANGDVHLGTSPTIKLSRADRTDARLKRLEDNFDSHRHQYILATGPGVTGGTVTDTTHNPTLPEGETTGADEVYGT